MTVEELRTIVTAKIADFTKKMDTVSSTLDSVTQQSKTTSAAVDKAVNTRGKGTAEAAAAASEKIDQINRNARRATDVLGQMGTAPGMDALCAKLTEQTARIDQQRTQVQQLKDAYNRLVTGEAEPASIRKLQAEFDSLQKQIAETEAKAQPLMQTLTNLEEQRGMSIGTGGVEAYDQQIAAVTAQLNAMSQGAVDAQGRVDELKAKLDQLRADPSKTPEAEALVGKIDTATARLDVLQSAADQTRAKLDDMGKSAPGLEQVNRKLANIEKTTKKTANAVTKLGRRFKMLLVGKLLRGVIRNIGESFQTAAKQSEEFNRSMSTITSAGNNISNALITAVAPLINLVAPAIEWVAQKIVWLTNTVSAATAALIGQKNVLQVVPAYQDYAKAAEGAGDAAKKGAQTAKRALAGFDQITKLEFGSAGGSASEADPVQFKQVATESLAANATVEKLKDQIGQLWDNLSNSKPFQRVKTAGETAWGKLKASAGTAYEKVKQSAEKNLPRIVDATKELGPKMGEAAGNVIGYISIPFRSGAADAALGIASTIISNLLTLGADLAELVNEILGPFLDSINKFFDEHGPEIAEKIYQTWETIKKGISDILDGIAKVFHEIFGGLIEWWKENGDDVEETLSTTWERIWSIVGPLWDGINSTARKIFGGIKDFLYEIAPRIREYVVDTWDGIYTTIKPIWDKITNTATMIFGALQAFWDRWGGTIEKIFSSVWWIVKSIFQVNLSSIFSTFKGVFESIGRIIDNVVGVFQGLVKFVTGVFSGNWSRAWEGVRDIFSNIFGGIVNIIKLPINTIIGLVNGVIRGFNKIKLPDWVPGIGGRGISIPEIPKLAQGAVLQANRPMHAIVGDNPTQREIVAPENTLKSIVKSAISELSAGGQSVGDITVITQTYLDGELIEEKMTKQRMRRSRLENAPAWG